jgi:hypothetical protein
MNQTIAYQRVEGGALFGACLVAFLNLHASWIWFVGLLLFVDLSLLGYLVGNRVGAHVYNLGHSLTLPALLAIVGLATGAKVPLGLALIWAAHIGMDRALGYGLKSTDGFKHTHLGTIGPQKPRS